MSLADNHGRSINYLRLSVTDRCNLRCRYCMPAEGVPKLRHADILSFEDLLRIARIAVSMGIEKIRVTGGEPTVRKGLVPFLERLASIDGLKELALTTNGLMLRQMAADLRNAGVQRLNVSLDSLRPDVYSLVTRGGDLSRALDGIAAADEAGFPPVKINTVVMRGINDGEVQDFAEMTLHTSREVRFIEYMPTSDSPEWPAFFVSGDEILRRIVAAYPLEPLLHAGVAGPARTFRIPGAPGTLGVITPISGRFCNSCNRIRVTASGMVKGCLFDGGGISLKPFLEGGNEGLRQALWQALKLKPEGHHLLDSSVLIAPFSMSEIGG
jgi:cyclic pyranopterin phosphate synthase